MCQYQHELDDSLYWSSINFKTFRFTFRSSEKVWISFDWSSAATGSSNLITSCSAFAPCKNLEKVIYRFAAFFTKPYQKIRLIKISRKVETKLFKTLAVSLSIFKILAPPASVIFSLDIILLDSNGLTTFQTFLLSQAFSTFGFR